MGAAGIDWRITQSDTNWEDIYCTFAILWDTGMCLDMTWLLNLVSFFLRPSLSARGTQMFSLCIVVHCLQNCLLGRLKMTANANVSYRLSRLGQYSFRYKDKKWCYVFYGWSIFIKTLFCCIARCTGLRTLYILVSGLAKSPRGIEGSS